MHAANTRLHCIHNFLSLAVLNNSLDLCKTMLMIEHVVKSLCMTKGTYLFTSHANNYSFVIHISNDTKQLRYEQCNIHMGISHRVTKHNKIGHTYLPISL